MSYPSRFRAVARRLSSQLAAEQRFQEQFLYGMREVFVQYCDLPNNTIFRGRFQHGFDVIGIEGSQPFRPYLGRTYPQWTWATESALRAGANGVKGVIPIGSAWLYQLRLGGERAFSGNRTSPSAIFVPVHGDEFRQPFSHEQFARQLRVHGDLGISEVLLHGFDFLRKDVREVWEATAMKVSCAGWPRVAPPPFRVSDAMGDRERFLANLLDIFLRHGTLVTNGLGSHVFFAASLGLRVIVIPPPTLTPSLGRLGVHEQVRDSIEVQHNRYLSDVLLQESWDGTPDQRLEIDCEELECRARTILGIDNVLERDELRLILNGGA
jgi:hypothetical protein